MCHLAEPHTFPHEIPHQYIYIDVETNNIIYIYIYTDNIDIEYR